MAHRIRAWLIIGTLARGVWLTLPALAMHTTTEPTAAGIDTLCSEIGNKLGSVSVADCREQDLQPSGHHSVLGRELSVKKYSPLPPKVPLGVRFTRYG